MKKYDHARATGETGVSSEIAPTERGLLWRWFRIRRKSKSLGMKINILVEVFRGSEGRTAFVEKWKRRQGLRLRFSVRNGAVRPS